MNAMLKHHQLTPLNPHFTVKPRYHAELCAMVASMSHEILQVELGAMKASISLGVLQGDLGAIVADLQSFYPLYEGYYSILKNRCVE